MTPFLFALAARIVPETNALPDEERAAFAALVDEALAERPPSLRRQLGLFLAVVRWLPVLRYSARFDRLAPARQDAFLRWLADNPIELVRKGFWGVKALVFLGYYGRPAVYATIGYRPASDGNALLGGAAS